MLLDGFRTLLPLSPLPADEAEGERARAVPRQCTRSSSHAAYILAVAIAVSVLSYVLCQASDPASELLFLTYVIPSIPLSVTFDRVVRPALYTWTSRPLSARRGAATCLWIRRFAPITTGSFIPVSYAMACPQRPRPLPRDLAD